MTEKQLVGIDVSAKTLAVSVDIHSGPLQRLEFANTRAGHQQLIRRLNKQRRRDARACLEWTGVYSLDLALALHRAPRIEVTVVNPRSVRDFAKAWLRRSKTDMLDADLLVEFVRRMPFRRWDGGNLRRKPSSICGPSRDASARSPMLAPKRATAPTPPATVRS